MADIAARGCIYSACVKHFWNCPNISVFCQNIPENVCVASPKVNYTLIRKQSYLFATGTTYKTFGTFDMKRQLTRLHTPMYNWGKIDGPDKAVKV